MAKFTFELDPALAHRRRIEDERQRALGLLQGRMAGLEGELKGLDADHAAASVDLRENRLTGAIDLAFLAGHRRFTLAVERRARALIAGMGSLERDMAVARRSLLEAAREVKVLEKLRERRLDEWRAARGAAEQREMDEVGGQLAAREIRARGAGSAEDG